MKSIIRILLLLCLVSCTKESPLSDVEIADPSLIQLEISLEKSIDNNGETFSDIRVYLYDKNRNLIKLKKGTVSVNDKKMHIEELGLNDAPYYTIDSQKEKVAASQTYVFYVELSDGKLYQASIVTQNKDFQKLELPKMHKKTEDMSIRWEEFDAKSDYEIELECKYKNGETLGESTNQLTISNLENYNGWYKIPKSYFNQNPGVYQSIVTVKSVKNGVFDSKFHPESKVESKFSIVGISWVD